MTHLVPEKRVNKNGIAVTKHVKVAATTTAASRIPAPAGVAKKPSKAKSPTSAQVRSQSRSINMPSPADKELLAGLKLTHLSYGYFEASDHQVYSVLSVVDRATAVALLSQGIHSEEQARKKLKELGLTRLLEDNSEAASAAQSRRIDAKVFIDGVRVYDEDSPYFMDAMEAASISALSDVWFIPRDINDGKIKLSDVKTLGASRIKATKMYEGMREILRSLSDGTAKYTAEDVKEVIDSYTKENIIQNALSMISIYGRENSLTIAASNYNTQVARGLDAAGIDTERSLSVVKYASKIRREVPLSYDGDVDLYDINALIRFYDSGMSAEEVGEDIDVAWHRLNAIENEGIAPSVSGGWL